MPNPTWEEYNTHNTADAVRGAMNTFDPTYYIGKALGLSGGIGNAVAGFYENSLGNPIGHSGKVNFGDRGQTNTQQMFQEIYGTLTPEELAALEKMGDADQAKWVTSRYTQMKLDPAKNGVIQNQAAAQKASAADLLREFAMRMTAPLDMNDPYVQSIVRGASGAAQTDARNRGLQGGMAVGNTERAVSGAMTAAQLQRNQLGAQALGQVGQLDLGNARLALDAYNNQYSAQLQQLAAQQSNRQAGGALAGATLGFMGQRLGIPGVNPQMGAQFGGGMAGLGGGGMQVPSYVPPASIGSNKQGGY